MGIGMEGSQAVQAYQDFNKMTEMLNSILTGAQTQQTDLADKLIKVSIAGSVNISELDYMGNLVDLYV